GERSRPSSCTRVAIETRHVAQRPDHDVYRPIRWAISRTPTPRARRRRPPAPPPGPPDSADSRRRAAHGGAGQAGTGLEAGADCRLHGLEDLRAVQARLYHQPRKILGWGTPAETAVGFMGCGTPRRGGRG